MITEADLKALEDALGPDLDIKCGMTVKAVRALINELRAKDKYAGETIGAMAETRVAMVMMQQELKGQIKAKDNTIRLLQHQVKKLKKDRREKT